MLPLSPWSGVAALPQSSWRSALQGPVMSRPLFVSYSVEVSSFALPLDDDLIGFDVRQVNAELAQLTGNLNFCVCGR
jgi:hypothetical protein